MTPKLQTLKAALEAYDRLPPTGRAGQEAHKALIAAVNAAGFDPKRAAEDWARYQVAVGEAADQINPVEEPEPESMELFG
jgi:hypothetical protein